MEVVYSPSKGKDLFKLPQRIYAFYGPDDRQKDDALRLLSSGVIDPGFTDFDLEILDAETSDVLRILSAVSLAPFGSSRRLVIVKGAEIFRRREKHSEAERLAESISSLPTLSCLALVAAAGEEDTSRAKTVFTSKLDTAIRECGALVQCKRLSEEATRDWLEAEAGSAGKAISEEASVRLIHTGHGDRIALRSELEKAICYVGDRPEITLTDVEAVCSYDAEDVMFKLVDATSQRNVDRALFLLREILRYDNKPQSVAGRLVTLLARQYRLLWQANELKRKGVNPVAIKDLPTQLAEQLPAESSIAAMAWKAGDLFRQARGWNQENLTTAFDLLLRTDLANKGSGEGNSDTMANLEMMIVGLCRIK